jgi:hypothetical protein
MQMCQGSKHVPSFHDEQCGILQEGGGQQQRLDQVLLLLLVLEDHGVAPCC